MSEQIEPIQGGAGWIVFTSEITSDVCIGDRGLRKQVATGRFPAPDGNLNGRNFWLRSTYERWKADVLAGRYSQRRRPGGANSASQAA